MKNEQEQVVQLELEDVLLLRRCITDASHVVKAERMMDIQSHVLMLAVALFKQRSAKLGGE